MPVVFRSLSAFIMISLLTAVSMLHAEDLEMITSADVEEMVGKSECNLHLVFFWATWCGPCKLEFPNYIRARQEYSDENLCISGISLDYDPSMAADYLERTEVNFPVYLAEESMMDDYELGAIPRLFLFDSQGDLIVDHTGYTSMENLQSLLQEAWTGTRQATGTEKREKP